MLGCNVTESPAEVALSYMNNLAWTAGMKRVFGFGFYVGTFGEYDLAQRGSSDNHPFPRHRAGRGREARACR